MCTASPAYTLNFSCNGTKDYSILMYMNHALGIFINLLVTHDWYISIYKKIYRGISLKSSIYWVFLKYILHLVKEYILTSLTESMYSLFKGVSTEFCLEYILNLFLKKYILTIFRRNIAFLLGVHTIFWRMSAFKNWSSM